MIPRRSGVCESLSECSAPHFAANSRKGRRVPAGPVISIIDDDASVRSTVVALVRSAGYEAQGFASAEEFLGCGTVESFACIITDIQMPGMSGIELKQHLTASQNAVPVIMITARHDRDLEGKALASGAACFLRKPFDADLLIGSVESALKA
jgi:FixJ family two-component response regulator